MTAEAVIRKLAGMGVTEKNFETPEIFLQTCEEACEEMRLKILALLNYKRPNDTVPDALQFTVNNWACARVIEHARVRDPQLCTYVKYVSSGTKTHQFGLRDPSKAMDPVTVLSKIPYDLIVQYRRL